MLYLKIKEALVFDRMEELILPSHKLLRPLYRNRQHSCTLETPLFHMPYILHYHTVSVQLTIFLD